MDIRFSSEESAKSAVSFAIKFTAISSSLARILPMVLLVGVCCGLANAQSLGYVVNSTSGTVTVFANATTGLSALTNGLSEDALQTVTFPTQSGQSAPSLVAAAVAPAEGSNTPKSRLVYVTDQANNQLWSFDVSSISQANAVAKPVSIATGSCSGTLFNQPSQIVIATPSSSAFAYVANKGNGTVTVVNVAAAAPSCVAIVSNASLGSGTITALATSAASDMTDVFVLTTTPAIATINTGTQAGAKLTLNPDQNQPPDQFTLSNPVSIAVQDDGAGCYLLALGDKGNARVSLAATPDTASGCSQLAEAGFTIAQGAATLIQPISLTGSTNAPNPVSVVSSFSSVTTSGSIYVADASNDEIWEIDCSATGNPCGSPSQIAVADSGGHPVAPSGVALSLLQILPSEVALLENQYLYVTGTSSAGAALDYANVGSTGGVVESFTVSSIEPGSGPASLFFSAVDSNDPPVAWFTTNNNSSPQGPVWVVRPNSGLTVLGASIMPLAQATTGLTLNFGLANLDCANFENNSNPTSTCSSTDSTTGSTSIHNNSNGNLPGTNGLGGTGSNTSDSGADNLDLSASTVFTVTLASCYNPSTNGGTAVTCPTTSPTADTQVAQQVFAGVVCTSFQIGPSASLALKQEVTATALCDAPANGNGPNGFDGFTATVSWGDSSTPTTTSVTCPGTGCVTQTISPIGTTEGNYQYEIATLTFTFANGYSTTGSHTITATLQDTSEDSIAGYFTTSSSTTASQTVTANALAVAISPTGSSSQPLPVKISTTTQASTQPFAGTVSFAASAPTVTAAITAAGTSCSPTCGTIGTVTVTAVSGTTTYNISATYTAPTALFTGTITLTFNVNSGAATAQAFIATTTGSSSTPPSCSFSSPPTNGQTALALSVALACTAPANDSLTATVNWSDGSPSTVTGTASSSGSATLTFTHTYANLGSYAVSVTSITDTTTGFSGTPPSAIAIKIYLTPTVTPTTSALATIGLGQSASFSVNIAGGAADANVTFSTFVCTGLPTGATCSFSPSSITLDANGNSTAPLVVTITLAGPTTAMFMPGPGSKRPPFALLASIWGLPGLGLVLVVASDARRKRGKMRLRHIWVALLLVLVILWMPACSSVQQSNITCATCAQSGTYPITITATSINPALQATTVFTLTVAQ